MKRHTRPPAIQTVSWEQTTVPHPHSSPFVIALVFNWIDDSDHLRRKLLEAAELISQSFSSGLLLLLLLCLLSKLDLKKAGEWFCQRKNIQTWFKDEIKKWMLAAACGGKTHQTLNAVLHNSCFSGHYEEKKSKISGNTGNNNSWYMLTSKETKFHHDLWPQHCLDLLFATRNLKTFYFWFVTLKLFLWFIVTLLWDVVCSATCWQKQDQLIWPQKSRASSVRGDEWFWIPLEKRLSARSSVLVGVQMMRPSADSGV